MTQPLHITHQQKLYAESATGTGEALAAFTGAPPSNLEPTIGSTRDALASGSPGFTKGIPKNWRTTEEILAELNKGQS